MRYSIELKKHESADIKGSAKESGEKTFSKFIEDAAYKIKEFLSNAEKKISI